MQPPTLRDVYRARQIQARLQGQTAVLVISGGNITLEQLRRVLADPQPW